MSQPSKNAPSTPLGRIQPAKLPAPGAGSQRQADAPSEIIPEQPHPQAGQASQGAPGNGQPQSAGAGPASAAADADSNAKGLASFLRGILKPDSSQQHADWGMGQSYQNWRQQKQSAGQQPKKPIGLFDAMDAPMRGLGPDDLRFADEVDAALSRRPRFGVRLLSIVVALMFLILIAWAAVASLDEVTHAEGQVVGSHRTQTIQNLEGGIIRSIQAHEGQIVEKGAVLAQLDNEVAESAYRDAMSKAIENCLALVRLEAELQGKEPAFPENLRRWLAARLGVQIENRTMARSEQMLADQKNTYATRLRLFNADMDALNAQLAQRLHEVNEEEARLKQLNSSLALAQQQRATGAELLRRKNFSRMEYLNLESKVVELQGQIQQLVSSIPRAKAAAEETRQKIEAREAEQRANISQEIGKRRLELTSLRETLSAGGDRVTRTELRAPVRGTIKQVHINTVGGVVKPGEPIMDLVPLDDTLLVEARVSPKDVAFLRPGQDVMVKITAYDFSIYGGLPGKLESISADTIEDKRGNFYYLVKVRTKDNALIHNNEVLPIIPGMLTTADILIGKKTVLDYLLKPILKAQQNAMRER